MNGNEFQSIKSKFVCIKAKKKLLENDKRQLQQNVIASEAELDNIVKARAVVAKVAEDTQKNIEYHISSLVSKALASVFPNPYEFLLRFVQRRGKTEADLIFKRNDNEIDDLLNAGGGGEADVASFALRVALWSVRRTRPVLILDETFKFLHNYRYQEKTSDMMKELSNKLGLQIIMVSDQPNIIKSADMNIVVSQKDSVSEAIELTQ
jgi:DNA repair exonuclease SbcCD ATPase subunit